VLREQVAKAIAPERREAILRNVGFVEAMVLTTCLGPADPKSDPLSIRAQNSFRLPCDGDAFKGDSHWWTSRQWHTLEPLPNFARQLIRKIYTYNGINAVICYLGAELGHTDLAAAARDPRIVPLAKQAGDEAGAGLIGEYGFDAAEQERWCAAALAKFADASIPDPIARNAADPARKLARDDRLVGPALLALKHGREPEALACGIVAAANFRDEGKPSLLTQHGSLERMLSEVCKLSPNEPLYQLVLRVATDGGWPR
jgi:mannitol-1-phosphate 5-dehydrogenase